MFSLLTPNEKLSGHRTRQAALIRCRPQWRITGLMPSGTPWPGRRHRALVRSSGNSAARSTWPTRSSLSGTPTPTPHQRCAGRPSWGLRSAARPVRLLRPLGPLPPDRAPGQDSAPGPGLLPPELVLIDAMSWLPERVAAAARHAGRPSSRRILSTWPEPGLTATSAARPCRSAAPRHRRIKTGAWSRPGSVSQTRRASFSRLGWVCSGLSAPAQDVIEAADRGQPTALVRNSWLINFGLILNPRGRRYRISSCARFKNE